MTKRTMVTGAIAAVLVAAMTMAVGAQGRRGPGGQLGLGQGPQGRVGAMQGRRGGQFLGGAGFGRGGRMGGGPLAALRGLGLTAEQREKVGTILESERATNQAARASLEDARQALNAAIFAASPDAGAIAAAEARLAGAEAARLAAHVKTQSAIAAILTPEQKAKFGKRGR